MWKARHFECSQQTMTKKAIQNAVCEPREELIRSNLVEIKLRGSRLTAYTCVFVSSCDLVGLSYEIGFVILARHMSIFEVTFMPVSC